MPIEELDGKTSGQVHWARYDEAAQRLEIDFKDKFGKKASEYHYPNVPVAVWEGFKKADSKGTYFATRIRPYYTGVRQVTK